jgi:mRNA-degrading endonuclease RelE of RelBE toxin-antitoxin system
MSTTIPTSVELQADIRAWTAQLRAQRRLLRVPEAAAPARLARERRDTISTSAAQATEAGQARRPPPRRTRRPWSILRQSSLIQLTRSSTVFRINPMDEVVISPEAADQFDDLPRPIQRRMTGIFERLRHWPVVSGARALSGDLAGHFRIRTGDYRVQFRVLGTKVIVERVAHRDGFYED